MHCKKSVPLLETSRQPAAPQSSEGIFHEQDQDSFKDSIFLLTTFTSMSRFQADIIVKDRLRSNIQFWRDIGAN